jgi:hypothetical protein
MKVPPMRRYDPPGGSGQMDTAPVSKTGDSRFESWLPRFRAGDSIRPDESILIRLVRALRFTVLGILVGTLIDTRRGARHELLATPSGAMAG